MNKVLSLLLIVSFKICFSQDNANGQKSTRPRYDDLDITKCALSDTAGNLWFGTNYRGLFCFDGKTSKHFDETNGFTKREILALLQDRSGVIWAATGDGAYRYDGKEFSRFPIPVDTAISISSPNNPGFITGHKSRVICCMMQDKAGNLWFGTMTHGVYRYDGKSFTNFLANEWIICMAEDKTGNLWFGSQKAGGLYRYDGGSFVNFTVKDGLADNWIRCITPDNEGNIWIGMRKAGICSYDGRSFTKPIEKYGECQAADPIFLDKTGNIWFGGCGRGVKRYDSSASSTNGRKMYTGFSAKDGLGHDRISTIIEDDAGNIWFGGSAGSLVRFDGRSFMDFSEKIH